MSVGEALGYLGSAFLLAAWHVFFFTSFASENSETWTRDAIMFGVAYLVAVGYVGPAVAAVARAVVGGIERDPVQVIMAAAAVGLAAGVRRIHPAVLTQFALIASLTSLAWTLLVWLDGAVYPPVLNSYDYYEQPALGSGAALLRLALTGAWWLAWAVGLGVIARFESRRSERAPGTAEDAAASRRAALTRFMTGLLAVAGTTFAVFQSNAGERVLPSVLGDVAILAVAGALFALAFRRSASAYLYPAAIAVVTALTDLNARYVADSTGVATALALEGLILVGAGLGASRLRRRLERRPPADDSPPTGRPEVAELQV